MKQPRVPEYREADGVVRYIKSLILFLKDFASEVWADSNLRKKEIEEIAKRPGGGGSGAIGMFAFSINEDGHLLVSYDTETPPPPHLDSNGHLIYTYTLGEETEDGADA